MDGQTDRRTDGQMVAAKKTNQKGIMHILYVYMLYMFVIDG